MSNNNYNITSTNNKYIQVNTINQKNIKQPQVHKYNKTPQLDKKYAPKTLKSCILGQLNTHLK